MGLLRDALIPLRSQQLASLATNADGNYPMRIRWRCSRTLLKNFHGLLPG